MQLMYTEFYFYDSYQAELEDTHEVVQILAVSYLVWRSHRQKNRVANILRDDLRADMIL